MSDEEFARRCEQSRNFDAMCWGIAWGVYMGGFLLAAELLLR